MYVEELTSCEDKIQFGKQVNRIYYVDVAKGIAIFCMVLGHTYSEGNGESILKWIYSFHMPLFFLTTGILYNWKNKKEGSITFDVKKKCNTLLLPYIVWNTLYRLFIVVLNVLGGMSLQDVFFNNLKAVLNFKGSAMWFLPVMFFSVLFFCVLHKNRLTIFGMMLLFLVGVFATEKSAIIEMLLRAFIGAGFILIGYYRANCFTVSLNRNMIFLLFLFDILFAFMNKNVSLDTRTFNNPLLYVLNGFLGTLLVYQIAMKCKEENEITHLLQFMGENSIKILCLHGFLVQIIRLLDYKLFGNCLPKLKAAEGLIFSLIVMIILTIGMPIINKLFNRSFGIMKKGTGKNTF